MAEKHEASSPREKKVNSEQERREEEGRAVRALIPLDKLPEGFTPGVLLSDKIIHLCSEVPKESQMIRPFQEKNLHPAGYKLTVGDDFALNGQTYRISSEKSDATRPYIKIEPFQVAIIRTAETLCIPRFLIARWNIVVKRAYDGLLWVGAAQVDPAWVGRLSCPIYNLSNEAVTLKLGDDLALMDFVQTTPVPAEYLVKENPKKWERYPRNEKVHLSDYNVELESALFTHAAQKITYVEEAHKKLESRVLTFTAIIMGALAVVPALLASLVLNESGLVVSVWAPLAIFGASLSLLLTLGHSPLSPVNLVSSGRPARVTYFVLVVLVAAGLGYVSHRKSDAAGEELLRVVRVLGAQNIEDAMIRNATRDEDFNGNEALDAIMKADETLADLSALEEAVAALEGDVVPRLMTEVRETREELASAIDEILRRLEEVETLSPLDE